MTLSDGRTRRWKSAETVWGTSLSGSVRYDCLPLRHCRDLKNDRQHPSSMQMSSDAAKFASDTKKLAQREAAKKTLAAGFSSLFK